MVGAENDQSRSRGRVAQQAVVVAKSPRIRRRGREAVVPIAHIGYSDSLFRKLEIHLGQDPRWPDPS